MAVRRYAIFDGSNKSTHVDVTQGGRAVEASLSLQDVTAEFCRGTVGILPIGVAAVEFLHYGESLSPETLCLVGLTFDENPASAPGYGGDASVGLSMGDGKIYHEGSVIETLSGTGSNVVYSLSVDFDRQKITFYRAAALLTEIDFPAGMVSAAGMGLRCYLSGSIGDGPAGRASLWMNSGQQEFESAQLRGLGWFETLEAPFNIRVGEREYLSPPTAEEPNTRFRGVIAAAGALSTRTLAFWPQGRRTTGSSALRLTLSNGDGYYDATIGGDFRDEPAELSAVFEDGTVVFLGSYVFDNATAVSDTDIQLVFRDSMAEIEKPGQTKFFLPNAEGSVANRAYPTTIGAAFSVSLVPYDLINRLYAVDSLGTARVGKVRDKGDPLEFFGSPPDYSIVDGGRAVQLRFDPEGAVTADFGVTSADLTALNGSPPLDVLGGHGSPFTSTPGIWTPGATSGDPGVATTDGTSALFQLSGSSEYHWLEYTGASNVLEAGKGYVIQFTVTRLPSGPTRATSFALAAAPSVFNSIITVRGAPEPLYNAPPRAYERTYELYYSPSFTHGLFMVFFPTSVTGSDLCTIRNLTVTEIPIIDPSEEDAEVDEEITPISLHGAIKQLVEDRWGLPPSFWSAEDALLIDAESGYAGVGWHAQEQYVRRQALEDILVGYTAASYIDSSNRLRFVRLVAPEDVADSAVAGEIRFSSDMLQDLVPSFDDAPGLTTRLGVRKNYRPLDESEIVTDFTEVPLSVRRRLAQDYRFIVSTGAPLAPGYSHADLAAAVGTALARTADGQAEVDRIGRIYSKSRAFYPTSTPFTVVGDELELGQIYRVFYPRYGMSTGVKLMFVEETLDPISRQRTSAVFWGLAPSELLKEQS